MSGRRSESTSGFWSACIHRGISMRWRCFNDVDALSHQAAVGISVIPAILAENSGEDGVEAVMNSILGYALDDQWVSMKRSSQLATCRQNLGTIGT